MKYVVASVGKNHRPLKVFSRHTNKTIANEKAIEIAKKHGDKFSVGVFGYTKDKFYGLLKSYDMFSKEVKKQTIQKTYKKSKRKKWY